MINLVAAQTQDWDVTKVGEASKTVVFDYKDKPYKLEFIKRKTAEGVRRITDLHSGTVVYDGLHQGNGTLGNEINGALLLFEAELTL